MLQEITRELETLLPRIFAERRKAGELDVEAVELAFRTALHSAGAAGLTELLRQPGPVPTSVPCACGGKARYKDMRPKPVLTVLGPAKMLRAYYWCSRCRQGQFPADIARDIEDTEFSPGVRRMLALVGSECSSFDHGRQQMELLADLEVTAKAVERVTEAIGADIARRLQETIQQAMQLKLPVAVGQPIQKMYVQMDGTGLPMVAKDDQCDQRQVARDDAELGAIRRRAIIDVVRQYQAAGARHVLRDELRMAGNVLAHVAGKQPAHDVETAARTIADVESNDLAAIKLRNRIWVGLRRQRGGEHEHEADQDFPHVRLHCSPDLSEIGS